MKTFRKKMLERNVSKGSAVFTIIGFNQSYDHRLLHNKKIWQQFWCFPSFENNIWKTMHLRMCVKLARSKYVGVVYKQGNFEK